MQQKVEMQNQGYHKRIIIFHVTAMSTNYDRHINMLVTKMKDLAKQQNLNVTIKMDSASKINNIGMDADIILLTLGLFAMEDLVKTKYPNEVVYVIAQKDYDFLNADHILKTVFA